ncbi:hypothetical protein GOP47_0016907, partial [Adiantum capillus-veneris]
MELLLHAKEAQSSPQHVKEQVGKERKAHRHRSQEQEARAASSTSEGEGHDTRGVKKRTPNPTHATPVVKERQARCSRSHQNVGTPASPAPMSRWQPPHVNFERKSQFCMTKAEAHEVYKLNCAGQDPRLLNEEDFSDEDWLQVFTEVPKRGSKVKCRFVKKESSELWYGANMESSKLQLKKQRWAAFHCASAPQSSRCMTMVTNVDDGDASRGSGLHNAAKFSRLGNLSLRELDDVGMAVALSQAKALTQYHEACKRRDAMQANVHRNEGA